MSLSEKAMLDIKWCVKFVTIYVSYLQDKRDLINAIEFMERGGQIKINTASAPRAARQDVLPKTSL